MNTLDTLDLSAGHRGIEACQSGVERPSTSDRSPRRRREAVPTLRVCVLGSGSGGNCTAVRLGDAAMLIDAGFGPVTTTRRLFSGKIALEHVKVICLTHLDQDHFRPRWIPTLLGWGIRVCLHRWHLPDFLELRGAADMLAAGLVTPFDEQVFEPLPGMGVRITPLRLAHDTKGTTGFHLETPAGRLGYATDLGHVPAELIERFAGVDLLAIESNYDPPMQLKSPRPLFLKRRIMGQAGHLSNQQAFEAVRQIIDRSPPGSPRHVVLLHRSQQCNRPDAVREVFAQDPRVAARVVLSEQRRRTRWFELSSPRAAVRNQMHFGF